MSSKTDTKQVRITCAGAGEIDLDRVVAFQGEMKSITRKNLEKLKSRILKNGFNVPYHIWIDKQGKKEIYYILDGHQRTKALHELRAQGYEVPPLPFDVIEATSIDDAKDKLLGISSQYGEFTMEGLREFSKGLEIDSDIRLPSGEFNLQRIRPTDEELGDDDVPDAAPKVAKLGDIWELGPHRLVVGSATSKEDVAKLMAGLSAQLVFTDPPYGVDYDSAEGGIMNDEKKGVELEKGLLAPAFKMAMKHSVDDAAFYVWHASSTRTSFERALVAAGLEEKQYIIWVKPAAVMGRGHYHWQHEPCFYCSKHGITPRWAGDRKETTVWTVTLRSEGAGFVAMTQGILLTDDGGNQVYVQREPPKGKKTRAIRIEKDEQILLSGLDGTDVWEVARDASTEYIHPNQKPVELSMRAIANHTEPGQIVLDLFTGSGSTLIGCERTDRVFRGTELDPHWANLIIKRWVLWVRSHNRSPELKRNGEPFDFNRFVPEALRG